MFKVNYFKKVLLCLVLIAFLDHGIHAQTQPYKEVSIASPTAASLGKYADIPVSYHTGIPQINIPIYSLKEGSLSLPVSLSYHAGGMKVAELASWVGAGWTLNAGGVITRSVNGAPDEKGTGTVSNEKGHFSDYGYNSYYYYDNESHEVRLQDGTMDGEPDLFFYNFNGITGKFFFSDDRTVITVPETSIKIEYTYTGTGSIQSFLLTTPDGTKYYFGKTASTTDVDPIETTSSYTSSGGSSWGSAISSWYLNKIESNDGLFAINLEYDIDQQSYHTLAPRTLPRDNEDIPYNHYTIVRNYVNGVRLKRIASSNAQALFVAGDIREDLSGYFTPFKLEDEANTTSKRLGSIDIKDLAGNFCKRFSFTYDYFTSTETSKITTGTGAIFDATSDKKRLRLLQVGEQTCDGAVTVPPHIFEYYTDIVPRRLSLAQDHWGFYNGAVGNDRLIAPFYVGLHFTPGANRNAKWPEMRGGALKKITYPTGGSTELEFESHKTWVDYSTYVDNFGFSISFGFDGNQSTQNSSRTFTSTLHKIRLTNTSGGGNAYVTVTTTGGSVTMSAEPGKTVEQVHSFAAGTWTVGVQKAGASTGVGAEAHFYEVTTSQIQENTTVGGLRVKSIATNDAINSANNMVTSYSYESSGQSTGILYSRPVYVQIIRNKYWMEAGYGGPNGNPPGTGYNTGCTPPAIGGSSPALDYFKSAASTRPMATTQGNHIGYNEVKVSQTGNGYTIYKFYGSSIHDFDISDVAVRKISNPNYCDPTIPFFPAAPPTHEYKRGELKSEEIYTEAGQKIKSTEYEYEYLPGSIETPALKVEPIPITGSSSRLTSFYKLTTKYKSKQITTSKDFSNGQSLVAVNTTFFASSYHREATRTQTTNSKGEVLDTKIKYAFDFRAATCDAISDNIQNYLTSESSCEATYQQALTNCTTLGCRYDALQVYKGCIANARSQYVTYRRLNFTNASNNFRDCMTNAKSSADSELKPVYEMREVFVNAPIEVTTWNNDRLVEASFFKYDYATTPAGKVYPSKIYKLQPATLATTFTLSTVSSNTLTKDSRYAEESSAKFYNGNIAEITTKAGVTTSYVWGNNNNLPVVKAVGVNQATLLAAYNAVSGNLATIRGQSSLNGSFVNTYEYNPIIGMTKETDPNSRNASYEYDGLYRLLRIRDHDNNIIKQYEYKYQYSPCTANWQNTATAIRCKKNASNQNTGEQEQEQKDMNPCSLTYNQLRWVIIGTNLTACPLPSVCTNCTAVDKQCINGVCYTGVKIYISGYYIGGGLYRCTYKYYWPQNGTYSIEEYTEDTTFQCNLA